MPRPRRVETAIWTILSYLCSRMSASTCKAEHYSAKRGSSTENTSESSVEGWTSDETRAWKIQRLFVTQFCIRQGWPQQLYISISACPSHSFPIQHYLSTAKMQFATKITQLRHIVLVAFPLWTLAQDQGHVYIPTIGGNDLTIDHNVSRILLDLSIHTLTCSETLVGPVYRRHSVREQHPVGYLPWLAGRNLDLAHQCQQCGRTGCIVL
jgi:hypothetical protein